MVRNSPLTWSDKLWRSLASFNARIGTFGCSLTAGGDFNFWPSSQEGRRRAPEADRSFTARRWQGSPARRQGRSRIQPTLVATLQQTNRPPDNGDPQNGAYGRETGITPANPFPYRRHRATLHQSSLSCIGAAAGITRGWRCAVALQDV